MAVQKSAEKWKNKQWFDVYAPKLFGDIVIGEIPATDEKAVIGRVIKVSLSWITHNPAHSFMVVGLRVSSANGNAAQTELESMEETYSYVHSLVRRHSSAIYTVDQVKDKAGKPFALKLIVVTRSRIKTPKKNGIRRELGQFVGKYVSSLNFEEFIKAVMENKFQQEAIGTVQHIAQIGKLDVKKIEL